MESTSFVNTFTGAATAAVFFALALSRETFFRFNRLYLLFSLLFSFLLPFVELPVAWRLQVPGMTTVMMQAIEIFPSKASEIGVQHLSLGVWIASIYWIGVLIAGLLFAFRLGGLLRLLRHSRKTKQGRFTLVYLTGSGTAFSFFHLIFLPASISAEDADKIMQHECEHARQGHSLDILFVEIYQILFWFNPMLVLYKKALKDTHEYLADAAVVEQYCGTAEYKLLIFRYAIGSRVGMANCFNQSQIKKRLNMLTKNRSNSAALLKCLFVLPLLGLMLFAFNGSIKAQVSSKGKTTEAKSQNKGPKDKKGAYDMVDEMPSFPGGDQALVSYIGSKLKYPKEAIAKKKSGKVYIHFIIDELGQLTDVSIARKLNPILDQAALDVVKGMPKWVPGKEKGQVVKVSYVLPISFKMTD